MTALLLCLGLAISTLGLGAWLWAAGARAGDRPGDLLIGAVSVTSGADGASVSLTAHNPGAVAVILGAVTARQSVRLALEGRTYTRVPRRSDRQGLTAGRYAVLCVLGPGESQTLRVPLAPASGRRPQLVLAIGERDRLRVIHRAIGPPNRLEAACATSGSAVAAPGAPAAGSAFQVLDAAIGAPLPDGARGR